MYPNVLALIMSSLILKDAADARQNALAVLQRGGVVVMPTDTLYGLVANALDKNAVEKVFEIRRRDLNKAVIVLISDVSDIDQFHVNRSEVLDSFLSTVWPGPVSVVLPLANAGFEHLHRGTQTIAFRLPADSSLRAFLRRSGPLIAPSANLSGEPAATTIDEAEKYFGDTVGLYLDGGERQSAPSTLVEWTPHGVQVLRPGAVKLSC